MCVLVLNLFVLFLGGVEVEFFFFDFKSGLLLGLGLLFIDMGVMFDVDDRVLLGVFFFGYFLY